MAGRINSARCNDCGNVLVSEHVHDFRTCSCGNLSVDGGPAYVRRLWRSDGPGYTELSTGFPEDEVRR